MSYPYVQATADYGVRKGPVKAFVVHMAEGGGTVGYLSNPTVPRGVSVHYVIETTGRIVQMLQESHASGSIDPTKIRTTDDPDGFYGVTAARAVMGDWWRDPNSAVISCEIEGFAANGPNAAQHGSLKTLIADVRSRFPSLGLLGHRDFADYKACPGKFIHWEDLGGHGAEEEMGLQVTISVPRAGTLDIPAGTDAIRVSTATHYTVPTQVRRAAYAAALTGGLSSPGYLVDLDGDELHFIRAGQLTFTPGDCADQVAAEHERTRTAAIAAVEAIR